MKYIILLILGTFFFNPFGSSERSLARKGNQHYEQQKYGMAEISYQKSINREVDTDLPEAVFNLGDALFQQERYAEAAEQFTKASAIAESKTLKALSYYNLGNSQLKGFIAQAKAAQSAQVQMQGADGGAGGAVEVNGDLLKQAVNSFKNSLKIDPSDMDAKYNLTYAMDLLKQMQQKEQDQQKQEQQEQQEKQEQQEQQEKQEQEQKEKKEQQEQQDQENKEEDQSEEKKEEDENSDKQQKQEQSENQNQKENEDSEEQQDTNNESEDKREDENSQDEQEGEGEKKDENAENKNKKGKGEKAEEQEDSEQDPNAEPTPSNEMPEPQEMRELTKEEAARLLEALKNEEINVQKKLLRKQGRGKAAKVDKDW